LLPERVRTGRERWIQSVREGLSMPVDGPSLLCVAIVESIEYAT